MKRCIIARCALVVLAVLCASPAWAKAIRFKIPGTNKTVSIQEPVYLAHGINSSNQTWGRGVAQCFVHHLRQYGYSINDNLFMTGFSRFGDTAAEQAAWEKVQKALTQGLLFPVPAPIGPIPISAPLPLSSLNALPAAERAILLYQGMGFGRNGNDSLLRNVMQVGADTKAIMNSPVPELARAGVFMTYGALKEAVKSEYPGFGIVGIGHSNGGRALTSFSQQTPENGYAPVRMDQVWDYEKRIRREQQIPSAAEITNNPNAKIPSYDNSFSRIIGLGTPLSGSPIADRVKINDGAVKLANYFTGIPESPVAGELAPDSPQTRSVRPGTGGKPDAWDGVSQGLLDKSLHPNVTYINILEKREPLNFVSGTIPGDGYTPASTSNARFVGSRQFQMIFTDAFSGEATKHTDMTASQSIKDKVSELLDKKEEELLDNDHADDNEDISMEPLRLPCQAISPAMRALAEQKGKSSLLRWAKMRDLRGRRDELLRHAIAIADTAALDALNTEYYALHDELAPMGEQIWREYAETADVAVLKKGSFISASQLAGSAGEFSWLMPPDFDPSIYKHKKMLVLPTGSLKGLEGSALFRARLDEFVKQGGVLLCFAQPYGYNYDALPPMTGNGLAALGWREDQSCYFKGSYLDQLHSLLKGQQDGQIDVYTDGFFTQWPDSAVTPIRRAKNDAPCVVVYPYGKGWVLATSLYMDWGFTHQQFSQDETQLLRDIMAWAKDPSKVLSPGEKEKLKFAPLQRDDAQVFITSNADEYAPGAPALFQVNVKNTGGKTKTFTAYYAFPHSVLERNREYYGAIQRRDPLQPKTSKSFTMTLAPGESAQRQVSVPVVASFDRMWVWMYDEADAFVASASRAFVMKPVTVSLTVKTPAGAAQETPAAGTGFLPIVIEAQNTSPFAFDGLALQLAVVDPEHKKVFEETKPLDLGARQNKNVEFNIPRTGKKGFYALLAELRQGEEWMGLGTGYLRIEEPIFDIMTTVQVPPASGKPFRATAAIRNLGALAGVPGVFRLWLEDPAGATLKAVEAALPLHHQTAFDIALEVENLGALRIGDYRLRHTLQWDKETRSGAMVLPHAIQITGKMDKDSYDAANAWAMDITLRNTGSFDAQSTLHVEIPAFHYAKDIALDMAAAVPDKGKTDKSNTQSIHLEGVVPDDATMGLTQATLQMADAGAVAVALPLAVRPSALGWQSEKVDAKAGGTLQLALSNSGGMPTQASAHYSLQSLSGNILVQGSFSEALRPGQSRVCSLAVPAGIRTGPYALVAEATDAQSLRQAVLRQALTIQGVEATLRAKLDQDSLQAGDTLKADILLQGLGLGNGIAGTLRAKIFHRGPSPPDRIENFQSGQFLAAALDGDHLWVSLLSNPSYLVRYELSTKRWKVIPYGPDTFHAANVNTIIPRGDDIWFLGTETNGGVSRWDKRRAQWVNYHGPQLSAERILGLVFDGQAVWFFGLRTVDRWDQATQQWSHHKAGVDFPSADIHAWAAHNGEIWLGTSAGAFRLDPSSGKWEVALPSVRVRSVAIGEKDVWIGIDESHMPQGAFRARVGRYDRAARTWRYYTNTRQENGQVVPGNSSLPSTLIDHIRVLGDWVWFGGTSRPLTVGATGLCRYNTREDRWDASSGLVRPASGNFVHWDFGQRFIVFSEEYSGVRAPGLYIFDTWTETWSAHAAGYLPFHLRDEGDDFQLWSSPVGSGSHHASHFKRSESQWLPLYLGFNAPINHSFSDPDGDLWFWTESVTTSPDINAGLIHYDWKRDEWEHIIASPDGLLRNKFWSLWVDGHDIWVGHADGISRYNTAQKKWHRYHGAITVDGQALDPTTPWDIFFIRNIQSDANHVWFFSFTGTFLYRYAKQSGQWDRFAFPVNPAHLMAMGSDAVWIASLHQNNVLARFDKAQSKFTLHSFGSEPDSFAQFRSIRTMVSTGQDVWFLFGGGPFGFHQILHRYHEPGQWSMLRIGDAGVDDISFRGVVQRGNEFLFAGNRGILRLNDGTGQWSCLRANADGLLHDTLFGIALRDHEVWLGTEKGMQVWTPETNAWRNFPAGVAQAGFRADSFSFGPQPNTVWWRWDRQKMMRAMLAENRSEPVWTKDFSMSMQDGAVLKAEITGLTTAGDYELVLEAFGEGGQSIAATAVPFAVKNSSALVSVTMDKATYLADEQALVTAHVAMPAASAPASMPVGIFYGDKEILFERVTLDGGESRVFEAAVTAAKGVALRVVAGDTIVGRLLDIRTPQLQLSLEAPAVAGRDPVLATMQLQNTGDADLTLKAQIMGVKDFGTLALPAGASLQLSAPVFMTQDQDVTAMVTGDIFQTVTRRVVYGVKSQAQAELPAQLLEGMIRLPWRVENTGLVRHTVRLVAKIQNAQQQTLHEQSHALPLDAQQIDSGILEAKLAPGNFRLLLQADDGVQQMYAFTVQAQPALEISVQPGAVEKGIASYAVVLGNARVADVECLLRSDVGGRVEEQRVTIPARSQQSIQKIIALGDMAAGEYPVSFSVIESGKSPVAWQGKILVPQGVVALNAPAGPITLVAGANAKVIFEIINSMSKDVTGTLSLAVEGIVSEAKPITVQPYSTSAQEFSLTIPADAVQGSCQAHYAFGQVQGSIPMVIVGPKINVQWQLDKPSYAVGETARLTLSVGNLGQPWAMAVLLKFQDHEDARSFALESQQQLVFDIPIVRAGQDKIFCSINTAEGRSLYIDRFDVIVHGDQVAISLNKQEFDAGDAMQIHVTPGKAGVLRLGGIEGLQVEEIVSEAKTYTIALPAAGLQRTQFLDYEFDGQSGRIPFHVRGDLLKFISGRFARAEDGGHCKGIWRIESSRKLQARFVVSATPQNTAIESTLLEKQIALNEGFNNVEEILPCNDLPAGFSLIRATLYAEGSDAPAAILEGGIEEGDASILSATLDKGIYAPGEPVTLQITSFGEAPTPMRLSNGSEMLWAGTVTYHSVSQTTLQIHALPPGEHVLTLQLGDNAPSTQSVRVTVQPAVAPLPDNPPADNPSAPAPDSSRLAQANGIAVPPVTQLSAANGVGAGLSLIASGVRVLEQRAPMASPPKVAEDAEDVQDTTPQITMNLHRQLRKKPGQAEVGAMAIEVGEGDSLAVLSQRIGTRAMKRVQRVGQAEIPTASQHRSKAKQHENSVTMAQVLWWKRYSFNSDSWRLLQMMILSIIFIATSALYLRARRLRRKQPMPSPRVRVQ